MTTRQYSSVIAHSTDAEFRAWGLEFKTELLAAGLIQASDTGQIDWTTAVRPVTATNAGYEMYRFSDSLQATAPVFIKIEYGSSSATAGRPAITITVGTATNGAGTLSGTVSTPRQICSTSTSVTTGTAFLTQICHVGGYLGVSFKQGAYSYGPPSFWIGRTCDSAGALTGVGVHIATLNGGNATGTFLSQSLTFSPSRVSGQHNAACLVPGDVTASLVGADPRAYLHYNEMPALSPVLQWCTVIPAEIAAGVTFSLALIGATPRTYLSLGSFARHVSVSNNAAHAMAMLWE